MPFFGERPRILIPVIDNVDLIRVTDVAAVWGVDRPAELMAIHVIEVPPGKDLSAGATNARAARVRLSELSEDRTREIAESEGARVVQHADVLPQDGALRGKGVALWKSLHETTGDP